MEFNSLSVMLIENGQSTGRSGSAGGHAAVERETAGEHAAVWDYATAGIPDDLFIRGDVPMTKEEVRSVTVSKLRLREDSVLYDIGAGTGSVSIECGLRMKHGWIYAIEKEKDALELIRKNIDRFGTENVTVVEGEAPEALDGLPEADRVFIGGSGGSMEGILDRVSGTGSRPLRVVVNAVVLENAYAAMEGLRKRGFHSLDVVCMSVSRGKPVGGGHLMQALNPVYIISAER
jgi:precorrin-6Y C5,15-methyltransferase (decarboxylating) CbiT subunit